MFDAKVWLADRVIEARGVTDSAWNAVAEFSILWQLFEQRLCNCNATVGKLDAIADDLFLRGYPQAVAQGFDYWRDRYVSAGILNRKFDDLFPNRPQWQKWQGRTVGVLLAPMANELDKTKTVLMVVYRLRNNLFHGTKEMSTFVEQEENLRMATAVLASVMETCGTY